MATRHPLVSDSVRRCPCVAQVCTLLEEPGASARGVAYLIPDGNAHAVLEALDFREKGGYTRKIAEVHLHDGSTVRALVYSATRSNPNFVEHLASTDPAALDEAAAIIAFAKGPSGPNKEYLLLLADAIPDDHYLQALKARVLQNDAPPSLNGR